jgi:hypothetical protein
MGVTGWKVPFTRCDAEASGLTDLILPPSRLFCLLILLANHNTGAKQIPYGENETS